MADAAFRRRYGASPWHLLALVVNFAVVGYVLTRLLDVPRAFEIGLWFAGAIFFQDFVLLPLLLVADRVVGKAAERAPEPTVPWRNHVRLPLLLAALLLLVFWPLVLRDAPAAYRSATGLSVDPYLWRWIAIVAAMGVLSAGAYAVRVLRARRHAAARR